MRSVIGFWIICLALTILLTSISDIYPFKEKVKFAILFMTFVTLMMIGVVLMVGV